MKMEPAWEEKSKADKNYFCTFPLRFDNHGDMDLNRLKSVYNFLFKEHGGLVFHPSNARSLSELPGSSPWLPPGFPQLFCQACN